MNSKKRGGFTLVELIIVVAVLALLSVGAVVAFGNVQQNARITTLHTNASAVQSAMNQFLASHGCPTDISDFIDGTDDFECDDCDATIVFGDDVITFTLPPRGVRAQEVFHVGMEAQQMTAVFESGALDTDDGDSFVVVDQQAVRDHATGATSPED